MCSTQNLSDFVVYARTVAAGDESSPLGNTPSRCARIQEFNEPLRSRMVSYNGTFDPEPLPSNLAVTACFGRGRYAPQDSRTTSRGGRLMRLVGRVGSARRSNIVRKAITAMSGQGWWIVVSGGETSVAYFTSSNPTTRTSCARILMAACQQIQTDGGGK